MSDARWLSEGQSRGKASAGRGGGTSAARGPRLAKGTRAAGALGESFAGGEAALAREAEVLARLEASLTDWWAWAKQHGGELAGDAGAVLRQRMADVLIEQLVATAVLAEARERSQVEGAGEGAGEGAVDGAGEGAIEAVALLRHRVRRCLQLASEALAEVRGEAEAAGELAWMRRELAARRPQLAPRGEGVRS